MTRLHLFADEAGCFTFSRKHNVSRFFVICTIATPTCEVGDKLLALRRQLAWERQKIGDYFHASQDLPAIRRRVFDVIASADFRIQATIMEKSKAQPHVTTSEEAFYKEGWRQHLRRPLADYLNQHGELHLTIASIGVKRKRVAFEDAIRDAVAKCEAKTRIVPSIWPCQSDPCLWVADYCTWAIFRKYESVGKKMDAYEAIAEKIDHEFDLWRDLDSHHY